ncbi:MAG: hypothetical protein HZA49_09720 [Planctomycetes bacterium]|nr:hypothetical protein [Planctomycetota bacterium]
MNKYASEWARKITHTFRLDVYILLGCLLIPIFIWALQTADVSLIFYGSGYKSFEGIFYYYAPKTSIADKQSLLIRLKYNPDKPLCTTIEFNKRIYSDWDSLYQALKTQHSNLLIRIYPDDRVPHQALVNALNILRKCNISRYVIIPNYYDSKAPESTSVISPPVINYKETPPVKKPRFEFKVNTNGWIIIILAAIVSWLATLYLSGLSRDEKSINSLMPQLRQHLKAKQHQEALALCDTNRSGLFNIIRSLIPFQRQGKEEINKAADLAIERETARFDIRLSLLLLAGMISVIVTYFAVMGNLFSLLHEMKTSLTIFKCLPVLLNNIIETSFVMLIELIFIIGLMLLYYWLSRRFTRHLNETKRLANELINTLHLR